MAGTVETKGADEMQVGCRVFVDMNRAWSVVEISVELAWKMVSNTGSSMTERRCITE